MEHDTDVARAHAHYLGDLLVARLLEMQGHSALLVNIEL